MTKCKVTSESSLEVFIELIFSVVTARPGGEERRNHTYKWQMNQAVVPESLFCYLHVGHGLPQQEALVAVNMQHSYSS